MNNLRLILDFYIFFSIIIFIFSGIIFLRTKTYKKNKIRILGTFLDLSKKQCVLLATIVLNIVLTTFCVLNIEKFGLLLAAMVGINGIIAVFISLNFHYAIAEIVYDSISILILMLLNLIHSFINNVSYDQMTFIFSIALSCAIVGYEIYTTARKVELVFKNNKYVRGNA